MSTDSRQPLSAEHVAIIGAGISGLAAAFRLKRMGADVTVFERAGAVGGRMTTIDHEGFRLDAGAGVLFSTYHEMKRMIIDAGLQDQVVATSDLLGFLRDGRVHRIHTSTYTGLMKTGLLGIKSKLALARTTAAVLPHRRALAWADLSGAASLDTEDIASYARRRLGDEAFTYLLDPLHECLDLSPTDRTSVVELFLYLSKLPGTSFFNGATGIDFLPRGLAAQLNVSLDSEVTSVIEEGAGVHVTWKRAGEPERTETFSAAVIALPAPQAASIHPALSQDQRNVLSGIRYSRGISVFFGLERPPEEPAMWLTMPRPTHADLIAVTLDHNRAPGRVPPGHGLVNTIWRSHWTDQHWNLDDATTTEHALAGLAQILPEVSETVLTTRVIRWDRAACLHPPGSRQRLAAFRQDLDPASRIRFAGDYFTISTTNSALCSGERAANELFGRLRGVEHPGGFNPLTGRGVRK